MSYRPRYPKADANQKAIVAELEQFGFLVIDVSRLPVPALDLFVCGWSSKAHEYQWVQVEVKTEDGQLNDNEQKYLGENPDAPILIARCSDDVLKWFGRV